MVSVRQIFSMNITTVVRFELGGLVVELEIHSKLLFFEFALQNFPEHRK